MVWRSVVVVAAAGLLAACSTAKPYGADRQLVQRAPAAPASIALAPTRTEPAFRVGPNGPMMTAAQLEDERMRRMRARVHVNPGLAAAIPRDGDYEGLLRR